MNVSQIYARFQADTDQLYRRAMVLAARHRIVRVHHLLEAVVDLAAQLPARNSVGHSPAGLGADAWLEHVATFLLPFKKQLAHYVGQDPTGCLDTPMTNSPTMRRVLQTACERRLKDTISPALLCTMGLSCWDEETPTGPRDEAYRRAVGNLARSFGITPPPACDFLEGQHCNGTTGMQSLTCAEAELARAPTAQELMDLIGPAVTEADLAKLARDLERERDPVKRARLAHKLYYLRERG